MSVARAVALLVVSTACAGWAATHADPPRPSRTPAYRVIPAAPTCGAVEGTVRLARAVPVPQILLPAEPCETDLTWRERPSETVSFDAARLTLADALVFLESVEAGKEWPEPLRAASPRPRITLRDGSLLPHVQWTRVGAGLAVTSEQPTSHANLLGRLTPSQPRVDPLLLFHLMLGPSGELPPSDQTVLGRYGILAVGSEPCFTWTRAYVGVSAHPYVSGPTALDGAFRIEGVPPGTYELVAWHGPVVLAAPERPRDWFRFGTDLVRRTPVTVPPATTVRVDVVLTP
jgi:hypothetical protein